MNLTIDDGVQEYELNGKCTIRINPTDFEFVKKMFNTFSELAGKDAAWREKLSKETDTREILGLYSEADFFVRESVDGLLGSGVCAAVFGEVNVMSFGTNGLPIWMNLVLAIMDTIDTAYAKAQKETNPAINKYLAKYKR